MTLSNFVQSSKKASSVDEDAPAARPTCQPYCRANARASPINVSRSSIGSATFTSAPQPRIQGSNSRRIGVAEHAYRSLGVHSLTGSLVKVVRLGLMRVRPLPEPPTPALFRRMMVAPHR